MTDQQLEQGKLLREKIQQAKNELLNVQQAREVIVRQSNNGWNWEVLTKPVPDSHGQFMPTSFKEALFNEVYVIILKEYERQLSNLMEEYKNL